MPQKIVQCAGAALLAMSLLIGCGNGTARDIRTDMWRLQADPDAGLYAAYDELEYSGTQYVSDRPDTITRDNFVAYYAYAGSASKEDLYLIVNEDADVNKGFAVYRQIHEDGHTTLSTGRCTDEESFLALLENAVTMQDAATKEGAYTAYAELYFRENGQVCCCRTVNVLEEWQN